MYRSTRQGSTLVNVVIVVALIVVAIGLMLPATRRVREASARANCQNNLKILALALDSYQSAGAPATPSTTSPGLELESQTGWSYPTGCVGPRTSPEERLSWLVTLLPYMEQGDLYGRFKLDEGYAENLSAAEKQLRTLVCTDGQDRNNAGPVTTYVAMSGIGRDAASQSAGTVGNGFMGYDRLTSQGAIKDGTSNTIFLVETRSNLGPWARGGNSTLRGFDPADLPLLGDGRPFGGHKGHFLAAFGDGAVRSIRGSIDPKNLAAMITIDGGESVVVP